MKKITLLFAVAALATNVNAQNYDHVSLAGTSYTQTFDGLELGRPSGWHVFTRASDTALGGNWDTSSTKFLLMPSATGTYRTNWNSTTGNFRNVASANGNTSALDSIGQLNETDRALGIRQVGASNVAFPNSDSGAAFAFKIENTMHKGDFALTFKLQSLDATSPRVTTWMVDYGFGDNPTSFTAATAVGTLTTGGSTFSNNTITVDFGTALDSLSTPVWIRVTAPGPLGGTTGSGNRTTSAIDDFTLTYVNTAVSVGTVKGQDAAALYVIGNATANKIGLACSMAEAGNYNVAIYDMTGRIAHAEVVSITEATKTINISNANLQAGMYMIRVSNGKYSATVKANVQ